MHNGDSLENLVLKFHNKLTMKAACIVGDIYAEEVVQEVWELLVRGDVSIKDIRSTYHWLMRVVTNKAINRSVREARLLSYDQISAGRLMPNKVVGGYELKHYEPSPEELLTEAQKMTALINTWEVLSELQQKVLELRYVKDFTYAQISSELSLSLSQTKVSLHRAKTKLISC
jgi:RNA polymerase sigma-70 factor (ECF subfamily)